MNDESVLPKVYYEKGVKNYDLYWDGTGSLAEQALHEQHEDIRGYIRGCFDALYDGHADPAIIAGNYGTLKNLRLETAKKLQLLIENVLHARVIEHHEKLIHQNTVHLHMRSKNNET